MEFSFLAARLSFTFVVHISWHINSAADAAAIFYCDHFLCITFIIVV